jgi:outer membrane protein TolC
MKTKPLAVRWSAVALAASVLWGGAHAQVQVQAIVVQPAGLSMQQLVDRVRNDGALVQSARMQRDLAATAIERAQAAFDPQLQLSVVSGYTSQTNTFEERLTRNAPDYWRRGVDTSIGLSQLLPNGSRLEAKLSSSRSDTNINQLQAPEQRPPGARDHRSQWSLGVVHPLARDAGSAVTQARVTVARLDTEASTKELQRVQTMALADAMVAYYELALAGERVRVAQAKIRMGERLLGDARALFTQGRLPEADVWEVENALARFQAEWSGAQQGQREKSNRLKALLMVSAADQPQLWQATDGLPPIKPLDLTAANALAVALERREDIQRLRLAKEREGIQLMYAQNQARPRLDLVASYGRGHLAQGWRDALTGMPSPTWSVGVQAQFPLGANRQGEADILAALLRQQEAELKLRSLELEIAHEVDTATGLVRSALERYEQWAQVTRREEQLLQLERQRLAAGRSGMREVLNREERALNAQMGATEQRVAAAQAHVLLSATQGVLEDAWR